MYRILAIDGGGIRGIIPAKWLEHLEQRLGGPIAKHFELIAGTSTGSILAAGLAAKIPASRLVALYEEHGEKIFPPRGFSRKVTLWDLFSKPKYDEEPLAEVLRTHFDRPGGQPILLGELATDCVVVTYDVLSRSPRLLQSWLPEYAAIPVWEACKASSSAPTYFPAHVMTIDNVDCPLVDGGVVANNPSSLAVALAIKKQLKDDLTAFEASQELFVLSMGTGNLTKSISVDDARRWGTAQWAFPILDVVFDATSAADEIVCEAFLKDELYVRMQVDLMAAAEDLDDASPENLNELKADATRYIQEPDGRRHVDRILQVLSSAIS
jgi:patatin-like phospholipase/acyl hydrolase